MKKFKKIFLFSIFFIFIICISVGFCFAQTEREVEIEYPPIQDIKIETITVPLGEYVKYIFYFAIAISGLLAFGALIYGGVRYLTSAGNPAAMADAKDQVFAGILGLVILLSSYLILNTVNPQLVILKAPDITPLTTTSLPSLKEGDVCLFDKKCNESDKKVLVCFPSGGGYPQKPAEKDIKSVEIKKAEDAVAFFEVPYYGGRRICFKDSVCDLTQYSFVGNIVPPFGKGDITDDINSINVITDSQCSLPGIVLPAGPKDDFSAAVLVYREKNYKGPAILIFFGEGDGSSTKPPADIYSIEILEAPLAVKLFDTEGYRGLNICFQDNVPDLTKCCYKRRWWGGCQRWEDKVKSFKVIKDGDCPTDIAKKTLDENGELVGLPPCGF